jgi:transcriptional regulator with XRE-family HTH domain
MKTKNELFLEAVDYLIDEGLATDQGDLAQKAGLGPNLISRVRNGRVKSVSDDSIRALASKFNLNMDFFRGKSECITRYDQASANLDRELEEAQRLLNKDPLPPSPQPVVPDFIQRLFDEAVRMQTRNELLERQCEQLIAELRDSKDKNESFLAELHKSKEFNDTLAAELKISRTQNENLITELRETRKENSSLASQLETAIEGIETMKNQLAMMMGQYTSPQPSAFPMSVNEDDGSIRFVIHDVIGHDGKSKKRTVDQLYALVPQGLIRGGRPGVTDEIVKQAKEAFEHPKNEK